VSRSQRTILILLAVGLVLVAAAVGYMLLSRQANPQSAALPTLVVLPSPTVTQTPPPSSTATLVPTSTPTQEASPVPAVSETPTLEMVEATAEITVEALPTNDPILGTRQARIREAINQTATAQASITPTAGLPPTSAPLGTLPPSDNTAGGEESTALNIGTGDLYVVAFTRPGQQAIADLGGSVSAAPAGQEWALLELLLVCTGADNCAPDSVALVGSSGATYTPGPLTALPPFTQASGVLGQIYGYEAFLVPTSETTLSLSVTRAGQTYTIGLRPTA
jgi:flagellar basal body-associated protein FliL